MRQDLTSEMPAHLQSKLDWAGVYADEETGGDVWANAAWTDEVSEADCREAEAALTDAQPDIKRMHHTGHCPESMDEPIWL